MDRLKLETAYRRALDVLMSTVDERPLQAATNRAVERRVRITFEELLSMGEH